MSLKPPDWRGIGQQLRDRRAEWGLTQSEVAAQANVSQRLVSKIERGGCREPSLAVLRVLHTLDLAYTNLPGGVNEPAIRVSEYGDEEEVTFDFWVDEGSSTIALRTSNQSMVNEGLDGEWYDFTLRLAGPARVAVRTGIEQAEVTVAFIGAPDAKVVVGRMRF
jgi:transcriptional regulator with XRE-family HTH domain